MSNAGDGDKRAVATDALMTLGTIIGTGEKRDAIHLAVEPVIAGFPLSPGQHVTVKDGVATPADPDDGLGIVDPFLASKVEIGQRFWFVMYPRKVHSLRHVWTHPAFPDTEVAPLPREEVALYAKAASEKWLRDFCSRGDCPGYEETIAAAVSNDDDNYLHFSGTDAHGEIPPEFWDHVEIVTGRRGLSRASYFSCSC
jgi:hypothetical protein